MDDTLDAYVVAACMHLINLPELDSDSTRTQEQFETVDNNDRYQFLYNIGKEILDKYIKQTDGIYDLFL